MMLIHLALMSSYSPHLVKSQFCIIIYDRLSYIWKNSLRPKKVDKWVPFCSTVDVEYVTVEGNGCVKFELNEYNIHISLYMIKNFE